LFQRPGHFILQRFSALADASASAASATDDGELSDDFSRVHDALRAAGFELTRRLEGDEFQISKSGNVLASLVVGSSSVSA